MKEESYRDKDSIYSQTVLDGTTPDQGRRGIRTDEGRELRKENNQCIKPKSQYTCKIFMQEIIK